MRCLNCSRAGLAKETQVCPGCGVHLPSFMRDVLPEGTTLHGGKYRIEDALGWGGFGITYVARHVSLNQTVAIKEFFPREHALRDGTTGGVSIGFSEKEGVERALRRFMVEGQMLAQVNHPSVVRVRDHFEEHGTAYLVMDLIAPARNLREELDARPDRRLAPEQVEKIAEQLIGALEAVHEKEVYHLDIKPDNVLLTPKGQAILVDFGAARRGLSRKSTQAYTLEYAAPEVLAGEDVGPESDLFELGMMLHEMLTGERPPSALSRLLRDTWKPLSAAAPWDKLIASALQMKKEERPGSVVEWWQQGQAAAKAKATPKQKVQTTQPEPADESQQGQEQQTKPAPKRVRKPRAEATDEAEAEVKAEAQVEAPSTPWTFRPEFMDQVKKLLRAGQKIEAVKLYREVTGASLKEAKDRIEAVERSLAPKRPPVKEDRRAKNVSADQGQAPGLIVTGEHGDAFYGDEVSYKKDRYYGRVSRGAELQLMDPKASRNEFGMDIIKVKVLSNQWTDEIGKIGWVKVKETNYAQVFGPSQRATKKETQSTKSQPKTTQPPPPPVRDPTPTERLRAQNAAEVNRVQELKRDKGASDQTSARVLFREGQQSAPLGDKGASVQTSATVAEQKPAEKSWEDMSPGEKVTGCLLALALVIGGLFLCNYLLTPNKSKSSTVPNFNTAVSQSSPTESGRTLPLGDWGTRSSTTPTPDINQNPTTVLGQPSGVSTPLTLHVQLLDVVPRPNGPEIYVPLDGAHVSFQAVGRNFLGGTDENGYVTFREVPCNTDITLEIRYKEHSRDWPIRATDLPCGESEVVLDNMVAGLRWTEK